MLGDEDRMAAHRRLLAVIGRLGGREAMADEIAGMGEHWFHSLRGKIISLLCPKLEPASEGRIGKRREDLVQRTWLVHRRSRRIAGSTSSIRTICACQGMGVRSHVHVYCPWIRTQSDARRPS